MADIATIVQKLVAPMHRRVMLMVGRSVVNLINDSTLEQTLQLQLMKGMTRDDVERYQEYGFTSVPLPGSEAVTVAVTGDTAHLVAIATGDRRYRPKNLSPGEVALFTHHGTVLHAKDNDEVHIGLEPANYAALANLVHDELVKIWAFLNTHTHATGTGPSDKPIETPPYPSPSPNPASVAAAKVKVK